MEINLLPWREETIAYNKKFFISIMSASLIVTGIFLTFVYYVFFSQVSYTKSYTEALESTKANLMQNISSYLDYKKTQKEMSDRFAALQKLQWSRFETVRLFNEIVKITPPGIYLNKLTRKDDEVEISGVSNSNLLISTLMKSVETSPELKLVSLQKVEKTEGKNLVVTEFSMKLRLTMSPFPESKMDEKTETQKWGNPITTIKKHRDEQDKKIEDAITGKK